MTSKVQIRKWIARSLGDFLKPFGFKIAPIGGAYGLVKNEENILKYHFLSQHSGGETAFCPPIISFVKVEMIMLEITKKNIYQIGNQTIGIVTDEILRVFGEVQGTVTEEDEVVSLCEKFKRHFVDLYFPAFERYSNPKNVLELWDCLDTVEMKSNYFGGPDKYMKILIFSKICHDPKFEERCRTSLGIYEQKVANGEDYVQELEWCQKVIEYLKQNEV